MQGMKEDIRRILLFAPVPIQEDLQCTVGNIIQPNLPQHNTINSYRAKILKCRMLIFSEPRVIASPVPGMDSQVYIIMSKDYYKSGQLLHYLEKIGIRAGRNARVTNSIYEACLRYTILARIAPLWNQVGSYLVKGRDFLLLKEPLHAITFDVIMTGKELGMIIWPYRLMMYHVSLEELMEGNKENIELQSEVEIDVGKWVYVLPSLNKAQVVSVSKKFPKSSIFSSYKQLKRHWKNSYGYRIPEEEDCPFYVTVTFGQVRPKMGPDGWLGSVFVYPGMCVCQCSPVILRCRDQTVPLQSFLTELSARVPQICGHLFAGDQVELGYAIPKLYSCSSDDQTMPSEQKFNLEDFMASFKTLEGICHVPVENPTFLVHSTYPSAELFSTKTSAVSIFGGNQKHVSSTQNKSKEDGSSNTQRNDKIAAIANSGKSDVKENTRYVPMFKSKTKLINYKARLSNGQPGQITANNSTHRMVNNSKETLNMSMSNKKNLMTNRQENTVTKRDNILNFKVFKQKIDGGRLKSRALSPAKNTGQCITKGPQNILPKLTGPNSMPCSILSVDKFSTTNNLQNTKNNTKPTFPLLYKDLEAPENGGFGGTTILKSARPDTKTQVSSLDKKKYVSASTDKAHYFTMEFGLLDDEKGQRNTSQQNAPVMHWKDTLSHSNVLSSGSNQHHQGSVMDGVIFESQGKLPSCVANEDEKHEKNSTKKNTTSRGRPVVQVGVDVEALAKEGMLSKANTTTLISWLRSRGVACRVKDKKSDLVHSVETFLGLARINHTTLPRNVQEVNHL